ncbi:MAG: ACT domain-containing protein, partial [Burkholderiales bacterium]
LLTSLSYKEASELAMFGAKVLHPRTILPAIAANIPVRVLNTFNPNGSGTLITKVGDSSGLIKAVTAKALVPLINIYSVDMFLSKGFLKKIFAVFAKHNISVDLVSASEVSVSVTLDNTENVQLALKELNRFANVTQINEYGSVSLVGEQIMSVPALLPKVFSLFEAHNIPVYMLSYNAMNINVVIVVPSRYVNKAVELLHANFLA